MLKKVLLGVAVLLAAVVALLGLALVNLETLVNNYRDDVATSLTEALARKVTIGPVLITWNDGLSAEFTSAELAGALPGDPPQADIRNVFLKLDIWKMVGTRGKELKFSKVTINHPTLHLRRDADGGWDFDDILEHLAEKAKAQAAVAPTAIAGANDWFKGLEIAGLGINRGTIAIDDAIHERRLVVDQVNVDVTRIVPGKDVTATLTLVLDDDRSRAPMKASVKLRPLPADLDFDDIPTTEASVQLDGLDLGTWGDLVPSRFTRPESGKLSLKLGTTTTEASQVGTFKGVVTLSGLELAHKGVRGVQSDLDLLLDVDANFKTQRVTVRHLDLNGPGVKLTTRLELKDHTLQGIEHADIDLKVKDLGRITAVAPEGSAFLPPQLRLRGPFDVELKGSSEKGELKVDLDDAEVGWGTAVDKAAGIPLRLDVFATRDDRGVLLKPLKLHLQDTEIEGSIHVPEKKGTPFTADIRTGDINLQELSGLFPAATDAAKKGEKLSGTVRVHVTAAELHRQQELHAELSLKGVDVLLPQATLQGDGSLVVDMGPRGQEAHQWNGDFKFTDMLLRVLGADGAEILHKPRGMPAEARFIGARDGPVMNMEEASIKFGQTLVDVKGKWTGLGTQDEAVAIETDHFDVFFDDLRALTPAANSLPRTGTFRGLVKLTGDPRHIERLNLALSGVTLVAGKSRVEGTVNIKSLRQPEMTLDLPVVDLDLTELKLLTERSQIPDGKLKVKIKGSGDVARLSTLTFTAEDLDARVFSTHWQGRGTFKNVEAPTFDARLEADKINVDALLSALGSKDEKVDTTPPENPHGLGKATRVRLAHVNGTAVLKIGTLTWDKYRFDNVDGKLRVDNGVFKLDQLDWLLYQGAFSAKGTEFDPVGERAKTHVVLRALHVDIAKAADAQMKEPGKVHGTLDASLDLASTGFTKTDLTQSLRGPVNLKSPELNVRGMNFLGQLVARLKEVVPVPGADKPSMDPNAPTAFRSINVESQFANGVVTFTRPVTAETDFGRLTVSGLIHLDSRIELEGGANLQPSALKDVLGFTPPKAVLVPVKIGGTWTDPQLTGVDVEAFARDLGMGALMGAAKEDMEATQEEVERQVNSAGKKAEDVLKDIFQ